MTTAKTTGKTTAKTTANPSSLLDADRTTPGGNRVERALPLAGVGFAVLSMAGNLTIGDFPDSDTAPAKLVSYYAAHHASVARGGMLLGYSAILFAVFGVALWTRVRRTVPAYVAGMLLVGTAVVGLDMILSANGYVTLGELGNKSAIAPAALQALHIGGSIGGTGAESVILLLPIALAGIVSRALPRWLAWSALVLAILHLTPLGFFAYLLFHLWAIAAGISLALRPARG